MCMFSLVLCIANTNMGLVVSIVCYDYLFNSISYDDKPRIVLNLSVLTFLISYTRHKAYCIITTSSYTPPPPSLRHPIVILFLFVYFRRLCDEEDELSEVEPDAVPSEVRDWLALTFTRSMSNIKRRGDDKPKFRSVAHAIRAGIMVDR